jgi:hypothetical protein
MVLALHENLLTSYVQQMWLLTHFTDLGTEAPDSSGFLAQVT